MKINDIINKKFVTVSVLEDTRDIMQWFKSSAFLVIADQEHNLVGILTSQDLISQPECRLVMDCNFVKPIVTPENTIFETQQIMTKAQTDILPVYEDNMFVGTISIAAIASHLLAIAHDAKISYQRVVHDLRNPLFNIQGLITLLNDSPEAVENMDILSLCSLSCKHAIDILEDLVLVEVYESKPLSLAQTEMNYFYNQCIQEQRGLSLLKNINIVTDLSTEPVIRNIDRSHFKRAVQNVIGNAVKFSYPESTIKISSKIDNEKLVLKISDAGVGIPAHLQPEIFNKFTKAQRLGTGGEASTGLGLCFSKECIEQHQGTIYFKSIEGQGSKFYISL